MMGKWHLKHAPYGGPGSGQIPGLTAQLIEIWEAYRRADDGFVMAARYVQGQDRDPYGLPACFAAMIIRAGSH